MYKHVEIWEKVRDENNKITSHRLLRIVYSNKPNEIILDEWLTDKTDCYCKVFK